MLKTATVTMLHPTEITQSAHAVHFKWMTLRGYRSRSQSFDSKYLENDYRYKVGPQGALTRRNHGLSIGTVRFDRGWPRGVKNQGHIFDVKYVKNGNSYDVGRNGDYTECPWASLWMTLRGYGERHVGIYASTDNWCTCFIYYLLFLLVQQMHRKQ